MLCIPVKGPTMRDAEEQLNSALQNADMIELRLDEFENLQNLQEFRKKIQIPVIFTLRSMQQGGKYSGSEFERLQQIEQLALLKPDYLDLEYDIPSAFVASIKSAHPNSKIILSYHNFEKTPADLESILSVMKEVPADFYKIAVRARSILDALRVLELLQNSPKNVIAVAMGELGECTRVLGLVYGSILTFASVKGSLETAPGQLTADAMTQWYNCQNLHPESSVYGLIGDPITKSISHLTHNEVFRQNALQAVYVKMKVQPQEIKGFLLSARKLHMRGISVTMPLKEVVMTHLDFIDPEAKRIGAVNTLVFKDNKIAGYNTDGIGALNAIEEHIKVAGKKLIILGAGGAAKAIAHEAVKRKADVILLNRHAEKAQMIAAHLGCRWGSLSDIEMEGDYDILINATSSAMPIPAEKILRDSYVMDIDIRSTSFLLTAKEKGCRVIYGHEMFMHQALGQFLLWFPERVDILKCKQIIKKIASQINS